MINQVDDLEEALMLVQRAYTELTEEGIKLDRIPIGAMIEVPSAVYQIDAIARRVCNRPAE